MSDMYLVLRRRLDSVAIDWIEIETEVLRSARKRQGWSYEAIARQIPIASKTWERWEKAGRVPRLYLDKVAHLLGLEIEQPELEPFRLARNGGTPLGSDDEAVARHQEVVDRLEAIESQLRRIAVATGAEVEH